MEIGVIVAVALVAANAFFVGAEFAIARLRPVMQPRAAIDYVTTSATPDDAIEAAMRTGRTRLPLVEHEGDLDGAVGVINAKDLLPRRWARESTCASSPGRCRGSPTARASTRCCATCAAAAAPSRSSSTSTAR